MTQRVVVIGATGHIGRPLCRELLRADILVRGKRAIPARASELGYRFRFPVLDLALHDLMGQPDNESVAAP